MNRQLKVDGFKSGYQLKVYSHKGDLKMIIAKFEGKVIKRSDNWVIVRCPFSGLPNYIDVCIYKGNNTIDVGTQYKGEIELTFIDEKLLLGYERKEN